MLKRIGELLDWFSLPLAGLALGAILGPEVSRRALASWCSIDVNPWIDAHFCAGPAAAIAFGAVGGYLGWRFR